MRVTKRVQASIGGVEKDLRRKNYVTLEPTHPEGDEMRKGSRTLGAMLVGCVIVSAAEAQGPRLTTRTTMKNDVGIELLGKALVYSFG